MTRGAPNSLQTLGSRDALAIDAVLLANEAFYAAFAKGDCGAMEDVWSSTADITCIHPGWPALNGRHAVMDSWRSILQSHSPFIAVADAEARIIGDVAYVICNEHLEPGTLIATNMFAYENDTWKMIHHQAGITPVSAGDRPSTGSATLQ
ncbi:MAG: nuclear transport factor 2 family protein [Rhodospirillales bacterium]